MFSLHGGWRRREYYVGVLWVVAVIRVVSRRTDDANIVRVCFMLWHRSTTHARARNLCTHGWCVCVCVLVTGTRFFQAAQHGAEMR